MYLHQQRFPDDYPDGLQLPLIAHLAELTSEYALPHDDDDAEARAEEDVDAADKDGTTTEGKAA
jgi:hypothetical protein